VNALDLLAQAEALGASVKAEGNELILRSRINLPEELIDELRRNKAGVLAALHALSEDDPAVHLTACRGCSRVIPAGTTLCVQCGSARSPLVRFAVELSELADERTLRGQVLVALDKLHYPRLRLPSGETTGPGLVAWCPVLRDANASVLKALLILVNQRGVGRSGGDRQ
jgi:RNA polymerase subunit RPABC4/transcription elongation factor Spt4